MDAPSQAELESVRAAAARMGVADSVVQWNSTFGLVVIEVRSGQVYVNGDLVEPAGGKQEQQSS